MNILALDLGTKFGYAILRNGDIKSGTKKLSKRTFGSGFSEFRRWLIDTIVEKEIFSFRSEPEVRRINFAYAAGGSKQLHAVIVSDRENIPIYELQLTSYEEFPAGMAIYASNLRFAPQGEDLI